jgi:hydroxypyruvate reductase
VNAVVPGRLIPEWVRVEGDWLHAGDDVIDLRGVRRMAVVGGGKAAGAMAVALEQALGSKVLAAKQVAGWVNVPGDCVVPTERVRVHAGRPAGVNEARAEGVNGTRQILELVASLGADDLCFCLVSGGGSALLVAPAAGVSLEDKIRVTRRLSAAGANIRELNTVRSQLSAIKAGGLARACRAGRLVSLVISDVPGDPLDVIASAPTVPCTTTADDALGVLRRFGLIAVPELASVVDLLRTRASESRDQPSLALPSTRSHATNLVIGNNAMAVDAAGLEAERLGYSHAMTAATEPEGAAEDVGRHLAAMAVRMRHEPGPDCLITGGEPTVTLADESVRGLGGRNQQLALAALAELGDCAGIALLAGGTDGEDGPTDAAGAVVTADVVAAARRHALDAADFLQRNDAYRFFEPAGGLFRTGPTATNVCDLRVVTVARRQAAAG